MAWSRLISCLMRSIFWSAPNERVKNKFGLCIFVFIGVFRHVRGEPFSFCRSLALVFEFRRCCHAHEKRKTMCNLFIISLLLRKPAPILVIAFFHIAYNAFALQTTSPICCSDGLLFLQKKFLANGGLSKEASP
jgi:hypothetical protein